MCSSCEGHNQGVGVCGQDDLEYVVYLICVQSRESRDQRDNPEQSNVRTEYASLGYRSA